MTPKRVQAETVARTIHFLSGDGRSLNTALDRATPAYFSTFSW